jgi:hypothetical protein
LSSRKKFIQSQFPLLFDKRDFTKIVAVIISFDS